MINFTEEGLSLEKKLRLRQKEIYAKSIESLDKNLIDTRIILISIFNDLTQIRGAKLGKKSDSINKRQNLIATYIKGITIENDTIFFGQYTKASTILKQSLEILTRMFEVKKGVEKEGKTPQASNLPKDFRKFNGHLNKIAHPSNSNIIDNLLTKINIENQTYISFLPEFSIEFSKIMFDLHILILYSIVFEKMVLTTEIYGNEVIKIMQERKVTDYMEYALRNLEKGGIIGM